MRDTFNVSIFSLLGMVGNEAVVMFAIEISSVVLLVYGLYILRYEFWVKLIIVFEREGIDFR